MLSKTQAFLWKYRGKIIPILLITLVAVPTLLGGTFFLLQHTQTVGYLISQEEVTIEVTAKDTKELSRRHCTVLGPDGSCAAYEIITTTLYLILTPTETFFTKAEIYNQLEIKKEYKVILSGWRSATLPPRRITQIFEGE